MKEFKYRKIRSIDRNLFQQVIKNSLSLGFSTSLQDTLSHYNMGLTQILDKHAPMKIVKLIVRPGASWYSYNILLAKRKRRRLGRSGKGQNLRLTDKSITINVKL